jgi:hypothetical protein
LANFTDDLNSVAVKNEETKNKVAASDESSSSECSLEDYT